MKGIAEIKFHTHRWERYRGGEPHYAMRRIYIGFTFPEILWTPDYELIQWVKAAYGMDTPRDKFNAEECGGQAFSDYNENGDYDPIPF